MELNMVNRKHPLAHCEDCPLKAKPCAPSIIPQGAEVAVVSRSPGYHEAMVGKPFSGPSGKVLDHLLGMYGYGRENVLLTNVVLCETDEVTDDAINACLPRLKDELANSSTIIAAGSEAVKTLLGQSTVTQARGYVHKFDANGRPGRAIATLNPAMVFKNDGTFPDLVKDFKLALVPSKHPKLPTVRWTNEFDEAWEWATQLLNYDFLASDLETQGRDKGARIVASGFSANGDKSVCFGEQVFLHPRTTELLRRVYERDNCTYLWHNGKFDVRNLRAKGIAARIDEDTMLMSYALDERTGAESHGQPHSLSYLLMDRLNWPEYEDKSVKEWKAALRKAEKEFRSTEDIPIPEPQLYRYNGLDVAGTATLFKPMSMALDVDEVRGCYENLIEAANALVGIELAGIGYDHVAASDLLETDVWPILDRMKEEMRFVVGIPNYNPSSSAQTKKLMYDEWGLIHNVPTNNQDGLSVDKNVREAISHGEFNTAISKHQYKDKIIDLAARLDEHSALDKQRSTYLEGLIPRAELGNGRIYADFNLHLTETGRTSGRHPNLQNVTRGKEGIPNIRRLFRPNIPQRILVSIDYSQAELRTISELSGDPELQSIYNNKRKSLHKITAARYYGENYTYEEYVKAKNINFGVFYGQSAYAFAYMYHMPQEEAQSYIDSVWAMFPTVKEWTREIHSRVRTDGYLQSPFGNKRRFYVLTGQNKDHIYKEAVNFLPQNIAAWLTITSIIELSKSKELRETGGFMVATVHDSIVLEVPEDSWKEAALVVKRTMENAPNVIDFKTPYTVDISVGPTWGDLEEVELAPDPLAAAA